MSGVVRLLAVALALLAMSVVSAPAVTVSASAAALTSSTHDYDGPVQHAGTLWASSINSAVVSKELGGQRGADVGDGDLASVVGVAAEGGSARADASSAAFRAADNVHDFTVPLKHQPWAGGTYNKFAEGVDQRALIEQALRSDRATFLPNNRPGSFRLVYDFGTPIGTRGQTGIRIVVGDDGSIWTAFPVKP